MASNYDAPTIDKILRDTNSSAKESSFFGGHVRPYGNLTEKEKDDLRDSLLRKQDEGADLQQFFYRANTQYTRAQIADAYRNNTLLNLVSSPNLGLTSTEAEAASGLTKLWQIVK